MDRGRTFHLRTRNQAAEDYKLEQTKRQIDQALEEGLREGLAKGLAQGRMEGKEEGLREGLEQMAIKMIIQGFDHQAIAQVTGLELEEILLLESKSR